MPACGYQHEFGPGNSDAFCNLTKSTSTSSSAPTGHTLRDDVHDYLALYIVYGLSLLFCLAASFFYFQKSPPEHRHALLAVPDLTEHEISILRASPVEETDETYAGNSTATEL